MRTACIDFETANHSDASICSAGLAVFEDFTLSETHYWLVRPPRGVGFFRPAFTEIHGLSAHDVQNAPEFPAIAPQLFERLRGADLVVAHNAPFDLRKLGGTLRYFGMPCPGFNCVCTLEISRLVWPDLPSHGLEFLAEHIHHEFEHHNAQADAEAAGRVMIAMVQEAGLDSTAALCLKLLPDGLHLLHSPEVPNHQHGLCVPSRAPLTRAPTREERLHELESELEDADLLPSEAQKPLPNDLLHKAIRNDVMHSVRSGFVLLAEFNTLSF